MTKRFKHSGTLGDLVYSLAIMKHFGGGEFYLHLNQIDWIGQHYYGSKPTAFHQGRMTQKDYEFMYSFMMSQDYITDFQVMDQSTEITHNLDRFRTAFVGHPGNYVDIYADTFGIRDAHGQTLLRNTAWLTTPNLIKESGYPYVVNRTARWTDPQARAAYDQLGQQVEGQVMFVGLPEEYEAFIAFSGWKLPYYECRDMLELAQVIGGCEQFIGNQSVALSLAIGLGATWACETRKDLPLERNECYFPNHPNGEYF
jgi:hypothetical protein